MGNTPEAACLNKHAYPTFKAAKRAAKGGKVDRGFKIVAYKCRYCPYYHIGRHRKVTKKQLLEHDHA